MKRNFEFTLERLPLLLTMMIIFFWDVIDSVVSQGSLVLLIIIAAYVVIRNRTLRIYEGKSACIVMVLLLCHGMISVIMGTNEMELFLMQFLAILASFLCFMIIVAAYKLDVIIRYYYGMTVIAAVVAIVQEIIVLCVGNLAEQIPFLFDSVLLREHIGDTNLVRVCALFGEPSFFVYTLSPAVYIAMLVLLGKYKKGNWMDNKIWAVILIVGYFVSFSSIGYLGIVIMIALMNIRRLLRPKGILAIGIAVIFAFLVYNNIEMVKVRVDDTIEAVLAEDISKTNVNLSSNTFVSHMKLSQKTFLESYGLGYGLGSYELTFDKGMEAQSPYIYKIGLNREDANSLLFRMMAELGILGLILAVIFIGRYYPRGGNTEYVNFANAMLVVFLLRILRQGNYFHGGVFFFICLYICIYIENENRVKEIESGKDIIE